MKKIITSIVLLTFFTNCKRDTNFEKDTQEPIVTITTPTAAQLFTGGQAINITGVVTDNNYISEIHIHVTNITTSSLLVDVHLYPGANTISFSQSLTAVTGARYKILVTAIDKAINEGRSSVEVSTN